MIEKARLYVEKYNRNSQELLLDFVLEEEFLYFKNYGDYSTSMRLKESYEPTMLLVHNFPSIKAIHEGAILTLDMKRLIEFRRYNISDNNNVSSLSATVFLEIQDGLHLAQLINESNDGAVSTKSTMEHTVHIESSWSGSPCTLESLSEHYNVSVWDVGQGNANCISDGANLTIFDFGSSYYYSKMKQKSIVDAHINYINGHKCISLIISHWDVDHYNLLCIVSDDFLKNLCCVFCPPTGIGLSIKQVMERIDKNCSFINTIASSPNSSHVVGIHEVCKGKFYNLYVGGKSKNKNLSGLLLSVHNDDSSVLFTADHSSHQIWNQLYRSCPNSKMLHIVVPHHGGNSGNSSIPSIVHPGIAAISVGGNYYGHPTNTTLSAYKNAGFQLKRTDIIGSDITIRV